MNPVPSFSERSDYLTHYTLSLAATKSGDFGAASWFASGSSVSDEVDDVFSEVIETVAWMASTWSVSNTVDPLSIDTETAREQSNESSGSARGECDETTAGKRHEHEEERQDVGQVCPLRDQIVGKRHEHDEERQDVGQVCPLRDQIDESREEKPKDNKNFDENIKEQFDDQKPPWPPSYGKATASDSSQVSKFKLFKKRVSHIFPRERKSKTDPRLLLTTSFSQSAEASSIGVSTMSDSITHNMSANSEITGASFPIQSTQRTTFKESPELQIDNDHEDELSIQRKRARFQAFTRITRPPSNPGRGLLEKKVVDKTETVPSYDRPVDQVETVLSTESDKKEIKIMETEDNDVVISQISPRIFVINDDSTSIEVSSVQTADESEADESEVFVEVLCCSPLNKQASNFSFDDESSVESIFDGQSESSASITVAIETIQRHAALLGISEHELLVRHCPDSLPTNEGLVEL